MEVVVDKADIWTPLKQAPTGLLAKIKKAFSLNAIPKFKELDLSIKIFTVIVLIFILFGMSILIVNVLMYSK
jgi:hypothetical protein